MKSILIAIFSLLFSSSFSQTYTPITTGVAASGSAFRGTITVDSLFRVGLRPNNNLSLWTIDKRGVLWFNTVTNKLMWSSGVGQINQFMDYATWIASENAMQIQVDGKMDTLTGSVNEYLRGDGSLAFFPVSPSLDEFYDSIASINDRYLTESDAAATYQPIGNYITDQNTYSAGYGITKTGSEPNASFSINQNDIMTVQRAGDSISSIKTMINGKASNADLLDYALKNGTNATGTWTINTSGNAATATKLATARNINGVPFDGTSNITIPGSPSVGTDSRSGYGTGSPYSLTSNSAKITMGTTSPSVTLPSAGTYMITSNLKIDYAGLTTLLSSTSSFKLRRVNNTPADIPNATASFTTPVVTLLTGPAGDADIQGVLYTTSTSGDIIEMWGNRGNSITVGNINVSEAWIVAVRIY